MPDVARARALAARQTLTARTVLLSYRAIGLSSLEPRPAALLPLLQPQPSAVTT